jgi:hypothetical protein
MICVTAPNDVILKRLERRAVHIGVGGITVAAAAAVARDFDDADDGDRVLVNDGTAADVVARMRSWFQAQAPPAAPTTR